MAIYKQERLKGVKPPPERGRKREKFPDLGNRAIVGLFLVTIGLSLFFWVKAEIEEWFGEEGVLTETVEFWRGETKRETDEEEQRISEVKGETIKVIVDLQGEYAVYFKNLESDQDFGINEGSQMSAASIIKVPIMLTLYKKAEAEEIDLETKYTLKDKDKVSGAGGILYKPEGTEYTLRKLAELMGKNSDNTAAHVLTKILGEEAVQKTIDELGMMKTSYSENETTAQDVGIMFEKLYREKFVSKETSEEILLFLTETSFEERIPAGVPEDVRVAHKIGTEEGVISDAGIIYGERPYILVILSQGVKEAEAKEALPEISKIVWEVNAQ